jgi:hypothetical protein
MSKRIYTFACPIKNENSFLARNSFLAGNSFLKRWDNFFKERTTPFLRRENNFYNI